MKERTGKIEDHLIEQGLRQKQKMIEREKEEKSRMQSKQVTNNSEKYII
jgi:hypothetical protein